MGLRLCDTCYGYQRIHSRLVPISKRGKRRGRFVGVNVNAKDGKYSSRIKYKNRMKYLGTYECEVKSAQHFDFICRIIGRTRRLNFPLTQSLPKFNIPAWIQGTYSFCIFFKDFS